MIILKQHFIEKLIIYKSVNKISLLDLSKKSGVNRVTISKIISGNQVIVRSSTFQKLSRLFIMEETK